MPSTLERERTCGWRLRHFAWLATTGAICALTLPGAPGSPAGALAAVRCQPTLPVSLRAPTANAAALQRIARIRLTAHGGARLRNVAVIIRRRGRTISHASRDRSFTGAAALRLSLRGTLRAGAVDVVVSGRQAGCSARRTMRRTLLLNERNLAIRVISSRRDQRARRLAVTLRSAGRRSISGLRGRLLDDAGATVAQATRRASSRGTVRLDFALRGSVSGRHWVLVTGRLAGAAGRRAFTDRIELGGDRGPQPASPEGSGVQRVAVNWSRGQWQGRESAGFSAPGIGDGQIVCRPDAQWIRVFPGDRSRDVAMMLWTFRDWHEGSEYAIREAELTRYTGPDFNEGFNKFHPAEKRSSGSFVGVIGDGLPAPGAFGSGRPPTELRLTWSWDFRDSANASCSVDATLTSQGAGANGALATGLSLGWRGSGDVPTDTTISTAVPGVGNVRLRCDARPEGARQIVIEPVDVVPGFELTTHEGSDTARRTIATSPYIAPVPNNGLVEVVRPGGPSPLRLVLSSRWKVNDPDPAANFCRLGGIVVAG